MAFVPAPFSLRTRTSVPAVSRRTPMMCEEAKETSDSPKPQESVQSQTPAPATEKKDYSDEEIEILKKKRTLMFINRKYAQGS